MRVRHDPRDLLESSLSPWSRPRFEAIREWVKREQQTLVVFDLEATQRSPHFRGFGIIEVGLLRFDPSGGVDAGSSFIDPERRIPRDVSELTGITVGDVVGSPNWGIRWHDVFHWLADAHLTAGFNSWTYDCRAVEKENERYGQCKTKFRTERHIDVYCLPDVGGRKLVSAAREFAIPVEGRLHRALADATITAHLLDRVILRLSSESLFDKGRVPIAGGRRTAKKSARLNQIEERFRRGERPTLTQLTVEFGLAPSTIENDLIALLKEGRVNAECIWNAVQQCELDSVIDQAIKSAWQPNTESGLSELKRWIDAHTRLSVDFFQLRICLIRHGYEYRSGQNGWVRTARRGA